MFSRSLKYFKILILSKVIFYYLNGNAQNTLSTLYTSCFLIRKLLPRLGGFLWTSLPWGLISLSCLQLTTMLKQLRFFIHVNVHYFIGKLFSKRKNVRKMILHNSFQTIANKVYIKDNEYFFSLILHIKSIRIKISTLIKIMWLLKMKLNCLINHGFKPKIL